MKRRRELVKKESEKENACERDRVKKGNFLPEIQPAPQSQYVEPK